MKYGFNPKEKTTEAGSKKSRGRPRKKSKTASPVSSPAHVVEHEKDDTRCEQCGLQIPDFEEFYEHINTDHTETCNTCGMAFVHEFYLREHRYLRHGGPRPPLADRPPSPPRRVRSIANLASMHIEEDSDEDDVDALLSPVHSPMSLEPSPAASYRIPKLSKSPAQSSPAVVESSRSSFQCDECLEACATAASLIEHVRRSHYDPSQPCSSSSTPTLNGSALLRHAADTHKQQQQLQTCHLCKEKFPRSRITQHLLQQHPDGKVQQAPAAAHRETSCDLCSRKCRQVNFSSCFKKRVFLLPV